MFVVVDDVLASDAFGALQQQVATSPLIGRSVLTGGFAATRGFGASFRPHAKDVHAELQRRMPFVTTAMAAAQHHMDGRFRSHAILDGIIDMAVGRHRQPNACYANVLCIPPGAGVDRHIDATLFAARADAAITPWVVAVLYVEAPSSLQGGALRLWDGHHDLATIAPKPNRLVLFAGHAAHAVETTAGEGVRVSVVVELYRLPWWQLRRVPRLKVQSDAFSEVMERLRGDHRNK